MIEKSCQWLCRKPQMGKHNKRINIHYGVHDGLFHCKLYADALRNVELSFLSKFLFLIIHSLRCRKHLVYNREIMKIKNRCIACNWTSHKTNLRYI